MADDASDVSSGSDIETDYEPVFSNYDVPQNPLEKAQGLSGFFDDNASDEEEFKGFRVMVFAPVWATSDVPGDHGYGICFFFMCPPQMACLMWHRWEKNGPTCMSLIIRVIPLLLRFS